MEKDDQSLIILQIKILSNQYLPISKYAQNFIILTS